MNETIRASMRRIRLARVFDTGTDASPSRLRPRLVEDLEPDLAQLASLREPLAEERARLRVLRRADEPGDRGPQRSLADGIRDRLEARRLVLRPRRGLDLGRPPCPRRRRI